MLAVVCPGQGSQTPGMLSPWLDLPGVAEQVATLSEQSSVDLLTHGTLSDEETIKDTAVAQPLIVGMSLIALRSLFSSGEEVAAKVSVVAGHSVGEFAAAAVAGVLTDASAVELVAHRARAMAAAAAATPTGMAAVIGGVPEEVLEAIESAGLYAANLNTAGQVVAAGSLEGIEILRQNALARARVMPLKVAGAFHTPFMQSAHDTFAPVAENWASADPRIPLLTNWDGSPFTGGANGHGEGSAVLSNLTRQIVNPVHWDLCQATLASMGITGILELAPGGVLTGIAKRTLPGVELCAVKDVTSLDAAREFIAKHSN